MPQPLADRIRPTSLDTFLGQEHLVGKNGVVRKMLASKHLPNLIFWGPPASGKTTLARIIGNTLDADFVTISAVMSGKEELKKILKQAQSNLLKDTPTIVFIDEIHRWNKAQQDALLPYVEHGDVILIGATTENPSFSIISALLSRCQVLVFEKHTEKHILSGLVRGYEVMKNQKPTQKLQHELAKIAQLADGDIRYALNILETILTNYPELNEESIQQGSQRALLYDKNGEEHYNLISAVHKSLRSSNASAGVYWITRMLSAGEDPLYITRRLIRFASEDIGNSNPNALLLANQVHETVKNIGMPECEVALVQLAEYLAKSPKNNSAYVAMKKAHADIQKYGALPVPLHIRNAPTQLMRDLDYGKGYEYDHDLESKQSDQQTMPDKLVGTNYFTNSK